MDAIIVHVSLEWARIRMGNHKPNSKGKLAREFLKEAVSSSWLDAQKWHRRRLLQDGRALYRKVQYVGITDRRRCHEHMRANNCVLPCGSDGDEVKTCEENNILVYTEKPNTSANRKKGLYSKDSFHYDSAKDVYICPAKQELTYRFDSFENDRHIRYYWASNCKNCSLRSRCNESQENKRITRWIHEDVNERMRERVRKWPAIIKLRRDIVEHPFGTLKRWLDQGFLLMRGLPNVRAEMSLSIWLTT